MKRLARVKDGSVLGLGLSLDLLVLVVILIHVDLIPAIVARAERKHLQISAGRRLAPQASETSGQSICGELQRGTKILPVGHSHTLPILLHSVCLVHGRHAVESAHGHGIQRGLSRRREIAESIGLEVRERVEGNQRLLANKLGDIVWARVLLLVLKQGPVG